MTRYLVTGAAGFIGSHLVERLLAAGHEVIGLDNFNEYYSPLRKRRNIAAAQGHPGFTLVEADLRNDAALGRVFAELRPERVAHLAAMAGPRPSVQRPLLYADVNVSASIRLMELAGRHGVSGFVQASTSSVYGLAPTPWTEDLPTDRPLSPYAATKKAAEVLAYTFHHQYGTPTRVLRFFTVYGPRGRPDMTPYLFVEAMRKREPITLFNGGVGVYRDWTFVDDIVGGVVAALDATMPFEIFNLGNSQPVELRAFVEQLEQITGMEAQIESRPLPSADPPITYADVSKARDMLGYVPQVSVGAGLQRFWRWYQDEIEQP
jgi:UDP-glucuronate 4-epimerase